MSSIMTTLDRRASEHAEDYAVNPKNPATQVVPKQASALQLNPAPSNNADDPLNWPMWLKVVVLIQTSLLAAIGGLNTATINPALVELGREFHISTIRASYQTTICIALNGIAPWIWIPLAHKYGRRPIYLATTFLAFASILGCAYARTYAQLLVARVFNGLFPVGFALGATTTTDLFFYHQRGRAVGFFTVTVTNGSHLAPIIGGLLGQYCGWRWIFKFLAIVDAVLFIVALFCLPETQYNRVVEDMSVDSVIKPTASASSLQPNDNLVCSEPPPFTLQTYLRSLRLLRPNPSYHLSPTDFVLPSLRMALYPSVLFPAIYYATMYGFASILPAVTAAAIFTRFFHWHTLAIGLALGTSLTIGSVLGEAVSGWLSDMLVKRAARQPLIVATPPSAPEETTAGSTTVLVHPEIRLRPIWAGEIIIIAGLLLYGFTLQYHTTWILPLIGMGMSCFGLQIITTATYTYAIDTHRHHSAEVAQLFNFIRQMFGMTFAFYVVRLGDKIGFQWTFFMFAVCGGILAFAPVLGLMLYGRAWREWADRRWGPAD